MPFVGTFIRHLYDLNALLTAEKHLIAIIGASRSRYTIDRGRSAIEIPAEFQEALTLAIGALKEDKQYEEEYHMYVLNMCFGEDVPPSFEAAMASLVQLSA